MGLERDIFELRVQMMGLRNEIADLKESVGTLQKWQEEFKIQDYLAEGHRVRFRDAVAPQSGRICTAIDAFDGFPWGDAYAFGLEQFSGNTARIYPGKVRHYGRNFVDIGQTDKTLTGSTSFVCVQYPLVGGSATIVVLNSEPDPLDSVNWTIPLYVFDQVATNTYRLRAPGGVRMGGHDIVVGNPMP
jgi:hypothetical protein